MRVRKFETPGHVALVSVLADERTACRIASPHFAPKGGWDQADLSWSTRHRSGCARFLDNGRLALEHLNQQRVECPRDDSRRVTIRDLVGEKILKLLELLTSGFVE